MRLIWTIIHSDWCGALPLEPDNILAHVWCEEGWRMSCAFAPDNDDSLIFTDAANAKEKAQEALDAWVQRHTRGWKGERWEQIQMTGNQIKQALSVVAPDLDEDQLESELTILYKPHWVNEDGEDMEAGLYALFTEYPEEGLFGPLKGGAES